MFRFMFSLMFQIYKVMLKGLLKIMPYLLAFSSIYSVILLIQENAPVSDIVVAILLMIVVNYFVWRRFGNRFRRENYDEMTGEEFEDFCVSLLKANGFYNVSKTKLSGDHGIDILATKNGKRYAIQCKRYSNNIGNKAVQEAYSGKDIYGSDVAVVMTNQYFTKQAINDARKLNVQLWDRNELVKLISSSRKKNIFNLFEKKSGDSLWKNETWGIPEQEKKDNYSESFIESYAKECNFYTEKEERENEYNQRCELIKNSSEIIKNVGREIDSVLVSFDVIVYFLDIEVDINKVLYRIVPEKGTRVKTVLSYKQEIELALGTSIEMELLPDKGCIGIIIPVDYLINHDFL